MGKFIKMFKCLMGISLHIFFVVELATGQTNLKVSLEIGPKFEVGKFSESGDKMYTVPTYFGPQYGLNLSLDLVRGIQLESGFAFYELGQSYRIEGLSVYNKHHSFSVIQIPLRLKYPLSLNDKYEIHPLIGFSFCVHQKQGAYSSIGKIGTPNGEYYVSGIASSQGLPSTFGLFELGCALQYTVNSKFDVYFKINQMFGWQAISKTTVEYSFGTNPIQHGVVTSKGNYYGYYLGICKNINAKK